MSNDKYDQASKKVLDDIKMLACKLVEIAAKRLPSAGADHIEAEALRLYKEQIGNRDDSPSQEATEALIMAIGIVAKKVVADGKREAVMSDKCNSCGAEIEYAAGSQSLKCQYCGATNEIQKAENKLPSVVDKIIPLTVSQEDLEKRVYGYMASGHLTPDDMLEASTFTKKECFYVPAFLFRVEYEATWTASFGYDRTEHYTVYESKSLGTDSRGHSRGYHQVPVTKTKTVTDWRPANGVDTGIVSVSTYAGKTLYDSALSPNDIVPFTIAKGSITSFNPSFMKGVQAENFVMPEASAYSSLKEEISSNIDHNVQSHGQGDRQQDWHWNAKMSYSTNTLYVPICHAVFDYQGTEYHVWIDGIGESEIRADKLPKDKGRIKSIYLGFIPAGVSAIIGILYPPSLVVAVFLVGYAATRSWQLIAYSKKIRDSLLTQIHASSSVMKETTGEERDKLARSFQRPEKPFFAKTHNDKIVLPLLSLLGFGPFGIGLSAIAAIFIWGYAAIGSRKKNQDSLLTQTHSSSNTIKEMGSEEINRLVIPVQSTEKPFYAKTLKHKIAYSVLSVFFLLFLIGLFTPDDKTNANTLKEAQQVKTLAAPAPIVTPAPTPPVVAQPETAVAVESASSAEWVKVGENKNGDVTLYADSASIRKDGNKVTMWGVTDFRTEQINTISGKPFLSHREQYEFDCKDNKKRSLNVFFFYAGKMGGGEVTHRSASSPVPTEWSPVTPGSGSEGMWKIACGQK